jgi:hypothetical protein
VAIARAIVESAYEAMPLSTSSVSTTLAVRHAFNVYLQLVN